MELLPPALDRHCSHTWTKKLSQAKQNLHSNTTDLSILNCTYQIFIVVRQQPVYVVQNFFSRSTERYYTATVFSFFTDGSQCDKFLPVIFSNSETSSLNISQR